MQNEYADQLLNMSYNELQEELRKANAGQRRTQSDFFFWAWQTQIDEITKAQDKLARLLLDILAERYGLERTLKYLNKLEAIKKKRQELKDLENS